MRVTYGVLIGVAMVLAVGFAIDFGDPRRTENPPAAWLWAAIAWVSASLNALLLVAVVRLPVPAWLLNTAALVVLVGQVGVFTWRWAKLRRVRRADRKATKPPA